MKKKLGILILVFACIASAVWAQGQEEAPTKITVMVPPWAEPSAELLKEFTDSTGIEVVMNIVGWDDIRNKVAIAAVGETAPADVFEVDWSWTGEFGAAEWLEPIILTDEEKDDTLVLGSFTYGGDIVALPYANDFRLGYYNTDDFKKAGFDKAPDKWEDMVEALKAIKAKGIREYPLAITLSATEAATTSFFWLTLSYFGNVFTPEFALEKDHALGTLKLIQKLTKDLKLIDPANQHMKDNEIYGKFTADATSFLVGPTYIIGQINNPELSKVVGKAKPTLVPGSKNAISASFALPEGVGVSKFSKNKDAAAKFVKWYTSPDVQIKLYAEKGNIPCHKSALQTLIDDGKIIDGDVMLEQADYVSSPFPGGIPKWYSEMSNAIYNNINKMVQGEITPEAAFEAIQAKLDTLRK